MALLLVVVALAGSAQEQTFTPDHSLILDAGVNRLGKKPPYIVRFAKGDRRLSFVAATHGNKLENAKTFKLVEEEFRSLTPEVMIMEGVPTACTSGSEHPPGSLERTMFDDLLRRMRREADNTETFYAAQLAYDSNPRVPCGGGEISNTDLKNFILKRFSMSQFKRFYVLRSFASQNKRGIRCEPGDVNEVAARAIRQFNRDFAEHETMTAEDLEFFQANYKNSVMEVQPNTGGSQSQRVSAASACVRDHHLAQVIANMLNQHKKVMIVYGAGHYETLYKVLGKMLGDPAN